ncbi:MAG: hypothetical protein Terrestrivirus5_155 [Terrestrivirus sp.]|uniref:Uncharacterized protein n=1 Tax=Terrestrivirus sp. TaxID=2487775 RepID=A0A3G4ZRV9_9VIRU|nr:MAG: hypothetical protein Terrestrivirus5_155 [Terrestrivirus sp.]
MADYSVVPTVIADADDSDVAFQEQLREIVLMEANEAAIQRMKDEDDATEAAILALQREQEQEILDKDEDDREMDDEEDDEMEDKMFVVVSY